MSEEETLLKPREVAAWLGVHVNTVKRLGDRGDIPYYRIGSRGDRRFRREDVRTYLQNGRALSNGHAERERGDARGGDEGEHHTQ